MPCCLKWEALPWQEAMPAAASQWYRHKEEKLSFNKQLQTSYTWQQSQHLPFPKKTNSIYRKKRRTHKQTMHISTYVKWYMTHSNLERLLQNPRELTRTYLDTQLRYAVDAEFISNTSGVGLLSPLTLKVWIPNSVNDVPHSLKMEKTVGIHARSMAHGYDLQSLVGSDF